MDRSKKMIIGGVAAVAVIVLVVVVARPAKEQQRVCVPSPSKPDVKSMGVTNLGTKDKTVLANMVGYVEFVGEKDRSYLTLAVDSVDAQAGNKTPTVHLAGQCVTFEVVYVEKEKTDKTEAEYEYQSMTMRVRGENAKEADRICDFDKPFKLTQPESQRYSCKKEQSHSCSDKGKLVANVVLASFEMEFGRSDKDKADQFEKLPWDGSCAAWDK